MGQIHKIFSSEQVRELLEKYETSSIERQAMEKVLGIERVQFFRLMKKYRREKEEFSVEYGRQYSNRKLRKEYEEQLREELTQQEKLIKHPDIAIYTDTITVILRKN